MGTFLDSWKRGRACGEERSSASHHAHARLREPRGTSPISEKGLRASSIALATLLRPGRTLFVSRLVGWACRLRASGGHMCMDARSGPGDVTSQGTKPPLRAPDPLHTVWCTPPTHVLCWRRPQSGAINHWAARRKASSVHARMTAARPQPARPSPSPRNRRMSRHPKIPCRNQPRSLLHSR